MSNSQQITELLVDWSNGDENVLHDLLPLVETELRRIAHTYMRREKHNHTLQTTALINEAYLKLVDQRRTQWQNRSHFFAISAQIMRRILLNHARLSTAAKRQNEIEQLDSGNNDLLSPEKSEELIALDDALNELAKFDKLKSQIVEMRYFGGLTIEETAEVLGIAAVTVSLHWRMARAWLQTEIKGKGKIRK